MDANQTREMLRTLEQELDALAARLRGHGPASAPDADSLGLAEGDRGTDLFDQVQSTESRESHFASRDRLVERLQRVSAALDRVKDGTYGECTECARPIPVARLRALPEATTCVGCQEQLERNGLRAARQGLPSIPGEIDAAPGRDAARRTESAEFRTSSAILESLRESVVPEARPSAPDGQGKAAPRPLVVARRAHARPRIERPAAPRGRRVTVEAPRGPVATRRTTPATHAGSR